MLQAAIMNSRIFHALIISLSLYGITLPNDVAAKEPTLKMALEAPAPDLAQAYLATKTRLAFFSLAEGGFSINLSGQVITKANAGDLRERDEKRLSLYRDAITQRGYKTIPGIYKGEATESCERIKSSWVDIIHKRIFSEIEITQDSMNAELVLKGMHEGEGVSLENEAAIAESGIAILDAMNSDYYFLGEMKDDVITIKPELSVLVTWPKWANPPKRTDLEKCIITLTKLSADSTQK